MGNDGGSIPKRRELVKEAARNPTTTQVKESLAESLDYHWTTDPLSNKPLCAPIVSDCTGKLYNKDSVLEYLLPPDADDDAATIRRTDMERVLNGNVKSLRDVVDVHFTLDASAVGDWVCPITNKRLGPTSRAVYLVPCGHVFAEAVVKNMAEADTKCLTCGEGYAANDAVAILPTSETEIARLVLRSQTLREKGLAHSLKKLPGEKKKKQKRKNGVVNGSEEVPQLVEVKTDGGYGIKHGSTASLTARVLEEQNSKRRKMAKNENLKSLFYSADPTKPSGKSSDFMTRGFTIPANGKR